MNEIFSRKSVDFDDILEYAACAAEMRLTIHTSCDKGGPGNYYDLPK